MPPDDAFTPSGLTPREKPLLSPWIGHGPEPTLFYTDARGQLVALALTWVGLARLGLTLAEAQADHARQALDPV